MTIHKHTDDTDEGRALTALGRAYGRDFQGLLIDLGADPRVDLVPWSLNWWEWPVGRHPDHEARDDGDRVAIAARGRSMGGGSPRTPERFPYGPEHDRGRISVTRAGWEAFVALAGEPGYVIQELSQERRDALIAASKAGPKPDASYRGFHHFGKIYHFDELIARSA